MTLMLALSIFGQFASLAGVLLLSARKTVRAKGFFAGILGGALWLYLLLIGATFLLSVVIPGLLIALGANGHTVTDSFPEAICVTPVVLLGWFPALVFSVIVRYANDITRAVRGKKLRQPPLAP